MSDILSQLLSTWESVAAFAAGLLSFWAGSKAARTKAIQRLNSSAIEWRLKRAFRNGDADRIKVLQFQLLEYKLNCGSQVEQKAAIDGLAHTEDKEGLRILARRLATKTEIAPEVYGRLVNQFEALARRLTTP